MKVVEKLLNEFIINEYVNNTYNFLYESDIQAILFSKLYYQFNNRKIKIKGENKIITTNPVKSEYPSSVKKCKNISRFDIGIIDEKNLKSNKELENLLKCNLNKDALFWLQKLKIGIEIKYFQQDSTLSKIREDIKEVAYKLNNYKSFILNSYSKNINYTGIGLFFFQISNITYYRKKYLIDDEKIINNIISNYNFKSISTIILKNNEINLFLIIPNPSKQEKVNIISFQ